MKLEPDIDKLEQEKSSLEAELSDGKLDYESLEKKSKRVADVIERIEEKLQRWYELGQYME